VTRDIGKFSKYCSLSTLTTVLQKRTFNNGRYAELCSRWHSTSNSKTVRIGCASGFWGDTAVSAPQLIHKGKLDFLVFDYLSEITMSLLTAARQKFPSMGYAPDFVQAGIGPYLKTIKQKGIRVISNAGGINPLACAAAIQDAAKKSDVDIKVVVVTGDDIMTEKSELEKQNVREMFSGQSFPTSMTSLTAYLGAGPIQRALDLGADIVVTGRCTDSALTLAPLLHMFHWSHGDYNLLAAGSLAGHLIECGAQATGGIFTDWDTVPDWYNIGFPIVECSSDGSFVLTKPAGTGGLVTTATVSEQLVYEIGDPKSYILPDVTCNFSDVTITPISGRTDAVLVQGARGVAPSDNYKVSGTYSSGYRLTAVCVVMGTRAAAKGLKTAEAIVKRVRSIYQMLGMADFTGLHIQMIGAEDSFGKHKLTGDGPRECTVWIAAQHADKKALEILAREIAPAGTGMAPGLCGIVGGRPKVSPVLKLFSFLYPKDKLKISIHTDSGVEIYKPPTVSDSEVGRTVTVPTVSKSSSEEKIEKGPYSFRLEQLAYARSGDKGNHCNIGVIARHPSFVPYIRQQLTAEAVSQYMEHMFDDGVNKDSTLRYELPGINGFNFLLQNALGGGGIASLRADPQGKAAAQMLLDFKIENVPNLLERLEKCS
jgi:hypothetical protein